MDRILIATARELAATLVTRPRHAGVWRDGKCECDGVLRRCARVSLRRSGLRLLKRNRLNRFNFAAVVYRPKPVASQFCPRTAVGACGPSSSRNRLAIVRPVALRPKTSLAPSL